MSPKRIIDPDGATVEIFPISTDEATLAELLQGLFRDWWSAIVFGPVVEGAAWEWRASGPPDLVHLDDGYLTVRFGPSHFHLCIGPNRGTTKEPVPEELARRRRTSQAELFRRLDPVQLAPVVWGLRLWNGADEQQVTIFFPNPFLSPDFEHTLPAPDWSRLELWDRLRDRWLGLSEPDPFDRSATAFRHGQRERGAS
jgi:hypothetical protein